MLRSAEDAPRHGKLPSPLSAGLCHRYSAEGAPAHGGHVLCLRGYFYRWLADALSARLSLQKVHLLTAFDKALITAFTVADQGISIVPHKLPADRAVSRFSVVILTCEIGMKLKVYHARLPHTGCCMQQRCKSVHLIVGPPLVYKTDVAARKQDILQAMS